MPSEYTVEISIKSDPSLQPENLIGQRGIGHLLFEAIAKALGSVGGYGDGAGFARDAATEIRASFDEGDAKTRLVFTVHVEQYGGR